MKNHYIKTIPKTVIDVTRIVTIHYYEFGPEFVFSGESHDFWELVYVDKGSVAIRQDDEEVILKQGHVVFHRPNEFHSIRAYNSSPNFFVISFVSSSLAMASFERFRARLDRSHIGFLSAIIKEAEKTYVIPKNDPALRRLHRRPNAPLGGEQLIKSNLEQLLIYLLRSGSEHTAQPIALPEIQIHPLIAAIQEYIDTRCEENVRITEICQAFGYSRSFLSKLFHEHTGESLSAYAIKKKMERSKELLRTKGLNISQVSERLAFENPQYFARAFKRHYGMTPSEYRKLARK